MVGVEERQEMEWVKTNAMFSSRNHSIMDEMVHHKNEESLYSGRDGASQEWLHPSTGTCRCFEIN